jgi:hypothetical protein
MLFGMESDFSQSPLSMLNTTFFATMFGLTYLCLDPLIKACYVLRCFYGTSLRSGEDLKAELRRIGSATPNRPHVPRALPGSGVFADKRALTTLGTRAAGRHADLCFTTGTRPQHWRSYPPDKIHVADAPREEG